MGLLMLLSAVPVLAGVGVGIAVLYVIATYTFITWDRTRPGSPNKDDTQVGLKIVLFALIIAAISLLAGGLHQLLAFVLGGFKDGSMPVRVALPAIFVGGGVIALVLKVLLPRTNMNEYTQAARFTVGVLALQYGLLAIVNVYMFVLAMFSNAGGWRTTSDALGGAFVAVAFAFPALRSFGSMSGWVEPPKAAPPAYPPAGYGGPPPGGPGYPPQGGYGPGSGPVGGAPPGGGFGGPPSGGMPPQGGGGYGPPGGGGFGGPPSGGMPPQGGGGGGYGPPGGGGGGFPPR